MSPSDRDPPDKSTPPGTAEGPAPARSPTRETVPEGSLFGGAPPAAGNWSDDGATEVGNPTAVDEEFARALEAAKSKVDAGGSIESAVVSSLAPKAGPLPAPPQDDEPTMIDDRPSAEVTGKLDALPSHEEATSPTYRPESRISGSIAGIRLRIAARTDVGLVREHNEDNFMIGNLTAGARGSVPQVVEHMLGERGSVMAVCDGMGGAAAGEVASQMAVDTIFEVLLAAGISRNRDAFARRLKEAIEEAGARIFTAAKVDRSRRGMGTTATVAGLMDRVLFVGQVGDSRAYVLRGSKFNLVTKDQSLVNQLIDAGQLTEAEAENFEHSNIILQALGTTEKVEVDLTFLELRRGDRLLLCSDGLSGLVHADLMKDVLLTTPEPIDCCSKLIEMANAGGGHDNISVIVADFDGAELALPTDDATATYQQYPLPPEDGERRSSIPAREPVLKAAGPKPGGEVKSEVGAQASAVVARESDPIQTPVSGGRWWIWALVIMALVAVAGWVIARRHDAATTPAPRPSPARPQPAAMPTPPPVPTTTVVRVSTDAADAQLFVDGHARGALVPGTTFDVSLPPGSYRLEARAGETVLVERVVDVVAGPPLEVALTLPAGAALAPPEAGVLAPGPTDAPQGAPDPAAVVAPSVEPTPTRGEVRPPSTPSAPTTPRAPRRRGPASAPAPPADEPPQVMNPWP